MSNNSSRTHQENHVLSDKHLAMLRDGSGISEAVIQARSSRSLSGGEGVRFLRDHGFSQTQAKNMPGLLLPLWTVDGQKDLMIYRPDNPRIDKKTQRFVKYELPRGASVRLDCPPTCQSRLADPTMPLWITEGQKKADTLASRGQCAVALLGVWNFKGRNDSGGTTFLADWDYIALDGRDVRIVFDSDVITKASVRQALERLTEHLQRKGAHVRYVYLPAEHGQKIGVDDYLVAGHSVQDLEGLIDAPRMAPKAKPPTMELLSATPKSITRPLTLVDGHGYATTWLWVRVTTTEMVNKQEEVRRLQEPKIEDRLERFVMRDDGRLYGDLSDPNVYRVNDLGLTIHLPESPSPNKLWSAAGVQAYLRGERPDPKTLFAQVADIIDRFIDFNRSLGDQRTMCELVACYILSTWFIEALTVIGYLWPNGERGSGKTQMLNIVTELAYLGQTILAGGSYAALRDLADYGATLAFDDAEAIMDVKRTDPDKRALLLAGNRKGSTITVKEPVGGREWRTRYVNTFCPRLFSAIRMPDSVLASRTIVVPLIRTPDRYRANADPLNYALWPHQREKLLDDLWALALTSIASIISHVDRASEDATLSGRNLEPWLAILAVASWLDDQGYDGVFQKMNDLSMAYQKERPDLEMADFSLLVVRALFQAATGTSITSVSSVSSVSSISTEGSEGNKTYNVTTSEITEAAKSIAEGEELDIDVERVTSRRVGRVLGKLRIPKDPDTSKRRWNVSAKDLVRFAISFGLISDQAFTKNTVSPSDVNACNAYNAGNACQEEGEV